MPTILSHPAVSLLHRFFPRLPPAAKYLGVYLTILPDADVVAFALGIPYEHTFGHRGFTHSILFAALAAALFSLFLRSRSSFFFLFVCALSHPVLDAMTTGGLGIAFFSPFSNERYFFPWRPIAVSPIGPRFFSERGLAVLASELVWVWAPCAALWLIAARRSR